MLKETSAECKVLQNKLNRLLLAEEALHLQLVAGPAQMLEIYQGEHLNLKVNLRDQVPPCFLQFCYLDEMQKDLTVHVSTDVR